MEFGRNHIVTEYRTSAPGLLVLAEAWYPGWTARINDSARIAVIPVNGWMRAIPVPAGANRVVFEYQPTRWRLGLGVSVASGALALVLWRSSRTRPPNKIVT
jgi:uncharacterized membrane protein YfhO